MQVPTQYTLPAQPVAGFTPDQLAAFQGVRDTQGMAQPYIDEAHAQAQQAGTPLGGASMQQAIDAYLNPYKDWVTANLQEIFGKQMRDVTGGLTQAAGGVGADRIAVGQSELSRQQGLSAGQTYADLYNRALEAAFRQEEGNRQRALQTGQLTANLGVTGQNAALQGINALLGVGGQQQQLSQAEQQALWNQLASQFSFPFQAQQHQAGVLGALAPAAGGTSQGTQVTQAPAPSLFSQIAGAGLGAVGTLGGMGVFGGGSAPTGQYGYIPSNYMPGGSAYGYAPSFQNNMYVPMITNRGGAVVRRAEGGGTQAKRPPASFMDYFGGLFGTPESQQQLQSAVTVPFSDLFQDLTSPGKTIGGIFKGEFPKSGLLGMLQSGQAPGLFGLLASPQNALGLGLSGLFGGGQPRQAGGRTALEDMIARAPRTQLTPDVLEGLTENRPQLRGMIQDALRDPWGSAARRWGPEFGRPEHRRPLQGYGFADGGGASFDERFAKTAFENRRLAAALKDRADEMRRVKALEGLFSTSRQSGGGTLLERMPFDLGPINLPPRSPGSPYAAGRESVFFPGDPQQVDEFGRSIGRRWMYESGDGRYGPFRNAPGTRASGGGLLSSPDFKLDMPALQPAKINVPQIQFPQPGGGGGEKDMTGDIISTAMKVLPMLLINRGGAVNKYQSGGGTSKGSMPGGFGNMMGQIQNWPGVQNLNLPQQFQQWRQGLPQFLQGIPGLVQNAIANPQNTQQLVSQFMQPFQQGWMPQATTAEGGAVGPLQAYQGFRFGGGTGQSFDPDWQDYDSTRFQRDELEDTGPPIRMPDQAAMQRWREDTDRVLKTEAPGNAAALQYADAPDAPITFRTASDEPTVTVSAQAKRDPFSQFRYPGVQEMPRARLPYPDALRRDTGEDFSRSPWSALARAGFAMMGGTSPYAGVNIGRGALEGLKVFEEQRKKKMDEQEINMRAQQMWDQMQRHSDQYKYMTPKDMADVAIAKRRQDILERQAGLKEEDYLPPERDLEGNYFRHPKHPGQAPTLKYDSNGRLISVGGSAPTADDQKKYGSIGAETPVTTPAPTAKAEPEETNSSISPVGGRIVTAAPNEMTAGKVEAARDPTMLQRYQDPRNRSEGLKASIKTAAGIDKDVQLAKRLDNSATKIMRDLEVVKNWRDGLDPKARSTPYIQTLFNPGSNWEQRRNAINAYNTYAQQTGAAQIPPEVIAAIGESDKEQLLGGFRNIIGEGMSAREAVKIIDAAVAAMPGMATQESASMLVGSAMREAAQAAKDRQSFFNDYRNKNHGFTDGWGEAFEKSVPSGRYLARTVERTFTPEQKQDLPKFVDSLRRSRDEVIAAERAGDQNAISAARNKYLQRKTIFDRKFGNTANYYMFGTF